MEQRKNWGLDLGLEGFRKVEKGTCNPKLYVV